MDNSSTLQKLGLSEIEAKIYLAALALRSPGAAEVAKKVGISRPLAFFHLQKMAERGLVQVLTDGKRRTTFTPTPPKALAEQFDRIVVDFKSALPQLEALQTVDRETPVIRVSESQKGYEEIYDAVSSMPKGSIVRFASSTETFHYNFSVPRSDHWPTFNQRMLERGIKTQALIHPSGLDVPKDHLDAASYAKFRERVWDVRLLNKEFQVKNLAWIYGDTVAFLFPDTSLVVSITHKAVAETFQAIFDALFAVATPAKDPWGNTT